jgi:hypothetical protein
MTNPGTKARSNEKKDASAAKAPSRLILKTRAPLLLPVASLLSQVNALRAEHGPSAKHRAPVTLQQWAQNTGVLENRTDTRGMLQLRLTYEDDGLPSVRTFPNFGMALTNSSVISVDADAVSLAIDLVVTAGKQKWQQQELQECASALMRPDTRVCVEYVASEATDWAGHAAYPDVTLDLKTQAHRDGVLVGAFEWSLS